MEKTKSVPFNGTQEQEAMLHAVIDELREDKGCLMPIMQKAQEIYGYLPYEVQKMISDELDVPMEKIYGVATFYSQFNLYPKGQYKISVCLGTACCLNVFTQTMILICVAFADMEFCEISRIFNDISGNITCILPEYHPAHPESDDHTHHGLGKYV